MLLSNVKTGINPVTSPAAADLKRTLELLQVEHQAERDKFDEKVTNLSLKQRVQTGTSWFPLNIKRSYFGMGNNLVLEVERFTALGQVHAFDQGVTISLYNCPDASKPDANEIIPGMVWDAGENEMRLVLNTSDRPEWLQNGSVAVDLRFDEKSFLEMKAATQLVLNADKNRDTTRLAHLRDVLLGYKRAEFESLESIYQNANLNIGQNQGVQKTLEAKDVGIIHGPPGTGKTTTLVAAIEAVLKNEPQVLVCAPSNAAVDLLTEKLAAAGLNVLRIGHPARVSPENLKHTLDAKLAQQNSYQVAMRLREEAYQLKEQARKYKRNFTSQKRQEREDLWADAKGRLSDARTIEKQQAQYVLDKAQVILSTLVGANSSLIADRMYSTVFIDEAAQALEPGTWIPVSKGNRVIFAGDHFQLPPTIISPEAARDGLSSTLFEKSILSQKKASTLLNVQYRMNQLIMNFSNRMFYENALEAHSSVANWHLSLKGEGTAFSPMEFIDTSGTDSEEFTNPESRSIFNEKEADLVLKHLGGLLPAISDQKLSIGIITPYKAQVNLLNEKIKTLPWYETYREQISIGSVDGFQGQERDLIYISLVRCNGEGEIGFLKDTRRMNVAMTRAKKKLVIIGDGTTLYSSKDSFYGALLDYLDEIQAHHSAWEF